MTVTNPSSSRRLLVLFVMMLVIFFLLAVRSEINAREIRQNTERVEDARQEAVYEACLTSITVLKKFNRTQQALAALEGASIKADPKNRLGLNAIREARVQVYRTSLTPIPECEKEKPDA